MVFPPGAQRIASQTPKESPPRVAPRKSSKLPLHFCLMPQGYPNFKSMPMNISGLKLFTTTGCRRQPNFKGTYSPNSTDFLLKLQEAIILSPGPIYQSRLSSLPSWARRALLHWASHKQKKSLLTQPWAPCPPDVCSQRDSVPPLTSS